MQGRPRYEFIGEPPDDRIMIFDLETNQPAVVDGVLLIGLSPQDAEWVLARLQAGETPSRKYLQALQSITERRR